MRSTEQAAPKSIDSRLLARIQGRGRGALLVPGDFLDLGCRRAVAVTLHRLAKKRTVRRLARGLYDYPKEHPVLGTLSPSADAIAKVLAARDHTRIQPAVAYAANVLRFSEQVPAKAEFLTDGPSRTVRVGNTTLQLPRTTPRNMAAAGTLSGLVVQALRDLGEQHITPDRIEHLRRTIPTDKRREHLKKPRRRPGLDAPDPPQDRGGTVRLSGLEHGPRT